MAKLIAPLIASFAGVLVGAAMLFVGGMVVLVCVAEQLCSEEKQEVTNE